MYIWKYYKTTLCGCLKRWTSTVCILIVKKKNKQLGCFDECWGIYSSFMLSKFCGLTCSVFRRFPGDWGLGAISFFYSSPSMNYWPKCYSLDAVMKSFMLALKMDHKSTQSWSNITSLSSSANTDMKSELVTVQSMSSNNV